MLALYLDPQRRIRIRESLIAQKGPDDPSGLYECTQDKETTKPS
jgi:hypothetical protein